MAHKKIRATPGGYGGKPPGVAIIGLPTGARKAGSGALTGDQSTDMNRTRAAPCMCQDLRQANLVTPFLPHAYRCDEASFAVNRIPPLTGLFPDSEYLAHANVSIPCLMLGRQERQMGKRKNSESRWCGWEKHRGRTVRNSEQ